MRKTTIFVFIALLVMASVWATAPIVEDPVTDLAGILTLEEKANLTQRINFIEKNTTVEIAVVTVLTTEGDERTHYANLIGDNSGVGKSETDNGIVIMWSMDNEKGGAIATGRGIESILNDAKVGRIGRASRVQFDNQDYFAGFLYIIDEVYKEVDDAYNVPEKEESNNNILLIFLFVFGIIFLIMFIANIFSSASNSSATYRSHRRSRISDDDDDDSLLAAATAGAIISSGSRKKKDDDDNSIFGRSGGSGGGFSFGSGGFGGGGNSF